MGSTTTGLCGPQGWPHCFALTWFSPQEGDHRQCPCDHTSFRAGHSIAPLASILRTPHTAPRGLAGGTSEPACVCLLATHCPMFLREAQFPGFLAYTFCFLWPLKGDVEAAAEQGSVQLHLPHRPYTSDLPGGVITHKTGSCVYTLLDRTWPARIR